MASARPSSQASVLLHQPIAWLSHSAWRAFWVYLPLHFSAAAIGFMLVHEPSKLSAFWPSAGLLLATLTMVPRRVWRGVLPAAFIAESIGSVLFDYQHLAAELKREWVLYAPLVNTLEGTIGAWLYLRGLEPRRPPELPRVLYAFIAVAIAVSIGATLGALGLYWRSGNPYWATFWAWWAGDLLGILAVAPMLLMWWWAGAGYVGPSDGRGLELAFVCALAIGVCVLVFIQGRTRYELPYALFPVLLWAAARYAPRIVATISFGVALLASSLHVRDLGPFSSGSSVVPDTMLPLQLFLGILLATSLMVSVAQHERRNLQSRLRDYAQKLTRAEDEARRQAAQYLQAGIGQMLVAARLRIESARQSSGGALTNVDLAEAIQLLDRTQRNARRLVADLTPPGLYELGLCAALDALALRLREQNRLSVKTDYAGDIDTLPIDRRLNAYRIAHALLDNVVQHAGVDIAQLEVRSSEHGLEITVRDQGRGFDPGAQQLPYWSESYTLFGIRDRVRNEGGRFEIESAPGRGCRISVALPANPLQMHDS